MFDASSFDRLRQRVLALERAAAEHESTRQALRQSESRFRAVFDRAGIGMAVVDLDGRLRETNPALQEMLGYARDDLEGISFTEFTHPDDLEPDRALARELFAGKRDLYAQEKRYITRDGRVLCGKLTASLVRDEQGEPGFAVGMLEDLTPYKQSEAALRGSEDRHRSILKTAMDGFWLMDDEGRILEVNEAYGRMTGYGEAELLEMTVFDLNAQSPDIALERMNAVRTRGEGRFESVHHRKDGTLFDVEVSVQHRPDRDGRFVCFFRDISERKRTEQRIRESEQRFRELFDHMRSGVMILDSPDGGQHFVIRDMNRAGLEIGRRSKAEVLGRGVDEMFPGIETIGALEVFRRVWRTDRPERVPTVRYRDDRLDLWVEYFVCRLPSGELVGIFEDFTAERNAELDKAKWERRIQQAQKMEAIGNLAGGVAHDFNNILFPIIGLSEMLLEDLPAGAAESENVREILVAAKRGSDLVKQIHTFSRRSDQPLAPVQVQQVLKEVLRLGRATIPSHIEIADEIDLDCRPVLAEPTQVYQIAMNLVTNAYHTMETTGGRMVLRLRETAAQGGEAGPEPGRRFVELTVSDTGPGIDPAIREKIFEPYFTTKEPGKGTGLGLSVVSDIVRDHGGEVRVSSEPGRGATFRVVLPLMGPFALEGEPEGTAEDQAGDEHILFVDDEESIVRIAKLMLERLGYRVTTRTGSIDALNTFKADPDAFDLLITDIAMPKMTGDRLAREVLDIRPELPVIVCTGYGKRSQQLQEPGVRGTLIKPITRSELAGMVRRVLDQDTPRTS